MGINIAVSGTEFDTSDGIRPLIAVARAARVTAVETWFPKNYTKDTVEGTHAALRAAKLEVACVLTPSTLYGPGLTAGNELLRQALDLAIECGARRVNTYFGHALIVDDEHAIGTYAEQIAPLVAVAAERGVVIVLENEFDAFGWDPAGSDVTRRPNSLARLVERLDSPAFQLNFDAANFHCAGVDPQAEAYPALREHIGYVHVKDIRSLASPDAAPAAGWLRYTDHGRGYSTVSLGSGEVPWKALLAELLADGYDGFLTLEPHCERSRLEREVRDAADTLRALLAQMGVSA